MLVPIAAAVRSPFAASDGVLAGWHPVDLAATVATALLDRAGLAPTDVDHVFVGCDEPVGAQGANVARAILLAAGWPDSISGTVIEATPHSGLSALTAAADAVASQRLRTVVVLGVASSSIVQPGASALARVYGRPWGEAPATRYAEDGGIAPPIVAADRAAAARGIDQARQDAWGLRSLERRTSPPKSALVTVGARPGESVAVQRDTPVESDSQRTIAIDELVPMFADNGTTSVAGFAPPADGVSGLVLQSEAAAPIGELTSWTTQSGAPHDPAGPAVAAVAAVGNDTTVGRWDVATSCAAAALCALDATGLDPEKE